MKVLFVTPYFYPKVGGLENYALNTAIGLQGLGHEVVVVTSNDNKRKYHIDYVRGIKVIRLPILVKLSNTPINPLWLFYIKWIIHKERPDCINAHTPVPFISDMAARAKGKTKFVLTYHNDLVKPTGIGKYLAKLFYIVLMNHTMKISDEIITTSEYYAKTSPYLSKYQSKLSIVSPGVDTEIFNEKVDKNWVKKRLGNHKYVLFTGNISRAHSHKGIDVLINSVAKLKTKIPNIHLILVGKGDAIPTYKNQAIRLGISESVTFTGFIPDEEYARYLAGSDVFVLPSTTSSEGFGMVLLEASACGTPVIGSNIGGVPYAIQKNTTGLLVKPGSVGELTQAIEHIITKPELASKLGIAGSMRAKEEFTWEIVSQKTLSIIENVVKRMRIVQLIGHYPPYLGGMENVAYHLATELAKAGNVITVLTSNIGLTENYAETHQKNYSVLRLKSVEFAGLPLIFSIIPRLLFMQKPAVFHVHIAQAFLPEVAMIVAKLRDIKFIAHFHLDVAPSGAFGFIFSAYKRTIFPFTLRRADNVIVFSDEQKDLVECKYGVKAEKIVIIPNGVSDEFFADHARNELKVESTILYVGRLTKQKNLRQLLEALKGISDKYVTRIVGSGNLEFELKQMAKDLKLTNVYFVGRKSGEQLIREYRKASIFVLPSEREGMPLVLLEAMASGLPIVGTNVIGIRDLVADGKNGYLVPLHNPESLQCAILSATSSSEAYIKLSHASSTKAREYTWPNILTQVQRVYEAHTR